MRACCGGAHKSSPLSGPVRSRRGNRRPCFAEEADGSDRASSPLEGLEHQTDGALDLGIGIKADRPVGSVDQADRWTHLEFAASCFVELAAAHARFEDMQLGLAHRALEAEQKTIVELSRIVDAVFIEDEGGGQRAQLDEAMPVGRVAGEPRDFQAHDDAGLTERHFADEFLEAIACRRARSGFTEVAVDDTNLLGRPARGNRAVTQRILALRTLAVFGDLTQRRLTDVEIGIALEMVGGDFEFSHGHGRAPLQERG